MRQFLPGLLLLFVIAIMFRVDFFFTVVYFLTALAVLSRLWLDRSMTHVDVRRAYDARAFAGDSVPVRLTVRNRSLLPVPWLQVTESPPLDLRGAQLAPQVVNLGPHECRHFDYVLRCRKRGYYRLGSPKGEMGDLLDLERRNIAWPIEDPMIVYPKILPIGRLGLSTRSAEVALPAPSALFEDSSRLMGVRPYGRGDSPRRIHWSASAHTQRLVVKQYQPAIARSTLVCLDLYEPDYEGRGRYDAAEFAIVVAASVVTHIVSHEGLPAGLATQAFDPLAEAVRRLVLPPRTEHAHLTGVLEVLARAQLQSERPFSETLRQECLTLPWGTTVLIVTSSHRPELLDICHFLRRRGLALTIALVEGSRVRTAAPDTPFGGLPVKRIANERDVAAWA